MCHLEHYCATLVSWPSHAHTITADQRMHSLLALPRGMCRIGGLAVNLALQFFGSCLIQLRHETFTCNRSVHPDYFTPDLGLTSFPGPISTLARNLISVPTSLATTKPARTQEVAPPTQCGPEPPPSVSPSATKVAKAGPASTTLVHNRGLFLCSTGIHPILGYLVQATKAGMYIELADLLPEVLSEVQFDLAKYTLKARDLQVHHNPGLECSLCHLHGHCCSFTAAVGLQPCNLHVHCD